MNEWFKKINQSINTRSITPSETNADCKLFITDFAVFIAIEATFEAPFTKASGKTLTDSSLSFPEN